MGGYGAGHWVLKIFVLIFCLQEVIIDGYKVPAGHYVGFLTRAANCDPKIFPEAEKFLPERWDTW